MGEGWVGFGSGPRKTAGQSRVPGTRDPGVRESVPPALRLPERTCGAPHRGAGRDGHPLVAAGPRTLRVGAGQLIGDRQTLLVIL